MVVATGVIQSVKWHSTVLASRVYEASYAFIPSTNGSTLFFSDVGRVEMFAVAVDAEERDAVLDRRSEYLRGRELVVVSIRSDSVIPFGGICGIKVVGWVMGVETVQRHLGENRLCSLIRGDDFRCDRQNLRLRGLVEKIDHRLHAKDTRDGPACRFIQAEFPLCEFGFPTFRSRVSCSSIDMTDGRTAQILPGKKVGCQHQSLLIELENLPL